MKEQINHAQEQTVYFDTSYLNSRETGLRYFKLPQFLLTNPYFWKLSTDAKVVYCVMLNRLPLSIKNDWKEDDLFYIYFSIETVQKMIQCSKSKAVRVMKELKSFKLIEGRRCSDHRRMRYFFLDISLYLTAISASPAEEIPVEEPEDAEMPEDVACGEENHEEQSEPQIFSASDTGIKVIPDCSDYEHRAGVTSEPAQVSNTTPIKTESSQTDSSHKDHHHQMLCSGRYWRRRTKAELKEGLSVAWKGEGDEELILYGKDTLPMLDRMIEGASAILSQKGSVRINGQNMDSGDVYYHLLMLGYEEVDYALEYLCQGAYQCTNFAAYALSVLYNAPEQADLYWENRVRRDEYYSRRYGSGYTCSNLYGNRSAG